MMNLFHDIILRRSAGHEINPPRFFTFDNVFVVRLPSREAGGMVEKMPKGNRMLAEHTESRNKSSYMVVEMNFLFARQHHDRDRSRQRLGQRRKIEDHARLERRLLRNQGAMPEGSLIDNFLILADKHDGARENSLRDGFLKSIFNGM